MKKSSIYKCLLGILCSKYQEDMAGLIIGKKIMNLAIE